MAEFFEPWHLLFLAIMLALFVLPFWRILKKAGFPPALSLLIFIPPLNLALLYYVAFADWKPIASRPSDLL
jgi:hypothetical protein